VSSSLLEVYGLHKRIVYSNRLGSKPTRDIVYRDYGSPDVLRYEELEELNATNDEVLIRVCAASVNPYDWHYMRGAPYVVRILAALRQPKGTRLGAMWPVRLKWSAGT
jgi:hypothetical protein